MRVLRLVFAADPAFIAEPVDRLEHEREIDFAFSGSWRDGTAAICTWPISGKIFLEALDQIAADDLHMIEIELDAHIRRADFLDEIGGVLDDGSGNSPAGRAD